MNSWQQKDGNLVCRSSICLSVVVVLFVVVSCQNQLVAATATYYVDSSASGSNNGLSEDTPWTLTQVNGAMAATLIKPGDHIKFKRGATFSPEAGQDKTLKITASGEANNPIVFESYGDPNDPLPIFDGSRKLSSWTLLSGNIYKHDLTESNRPRMLYFGEKAMPAITTLQFASVPEILKKNAILMQTAGVVWSAFWATGVDHGNNTVSGITFNDIDPNTDVTARQLDENGMQTVLVPSLGPPTIIVTTDGLTEPGHWYWDSGKLYLYSEGAPGSTVSVSFTEAGTSDCLSRAPWTCSDNGAYFDILTEHVVIKDIQLRGFNDFGIILRKGNNITIDGMEIYGCGANGIQMYNSSNITIQNNSIDSVGNGIVAWADPLDPAGWSVDNNILNNTVSSSRGSGISLSVVARPTPDPSRVSRNLISGNTISNANAMSYDGGGVYTWHAGTNTIESNFIHDCGSLSRASAGIEIDNSGDPMVIRNNTIERNSSGGIVVSGAGHQITGNTLRNNGATSRKGAQIVFFRALSVASGCRVTGNTMEVDQNYHFIAGNPGSTAGHYINYNTYRSQWDELFRWDTWDDQWMDFETWQKTTGHDTGKRNSLLQFMPAIQAEGNVKK